MTSSLDESWRSLLDAVAEERRWPTSTAVARVGAKVAALSAAYNDGEGRAPAAARESDGLLARLLFSFPRDVPKGAAAAGELVRARAIPWGPLKVLDVGAGLGAMTWGLVRELGDAGHEGAIDVTFFDDDAAALKLALRIAELKKHPGLRVRAVHGSAHQAPKQVFDVVIAGQVLSELDRELTPEERVTRHRDLLASLLGRTSPEGALVVVEPALRDRTRHLHAVRDALLEAGQARVFAPCLHEAPCPALATHGDWCHEDRSIDLPDWLRPVARAAGLRWEGLTFSYLVLKKEDRRLIRALPGGGVRLRVVSDRIVTKGKSEVLLCGEDGLRPKVTRLDRSRSEANARWDRLHRGDLIAIDPPPAPRVESENRVLSIDVEPFSQ